MCGLFGVIKVGKPKDDLVKKMILALAKASETRGTDAGGLSYYFNDKLQIVRNKGPISSNGTLVFDEVYSSTIIMGHTRASTQGIASVNENNHPFPSELGTFTLAHNGVLYNDDYLAREHGLKHPKITTDTYVAVQLLDKLHKGVINQDTLKDLGERVGGMFNFTILDEYKNLWIVKHDNPLVIWYLNDLQMLVYASTDDILQTALNTFYGNFISMLVKRKRSMPFAEIIEVKDGEILKIDVNAQVERFTYKPEDLAFYIPAVSTGRKSFHHWDYYGYEDDSQDELEKYYVDTYGAKTFDYNNLTEFLDFRLDMERVIFFNGWEEELSIPYYSGFNQIDSDDTFEIYSQLKAEYLTLPKSHLLGIYDGDLLLTPHRISNIGVPIVDDNGYNIVSKVMGELKLTPAWVTIQASIESLKQGSYELHKSVKESIVSSVILNFFYSNFMPEVNANQPIKPRYDYSELKYTMDFLDVLLFSSTSTSGYVNPKEVYAISHIWGMYFMDFLTQEKGGI